MALVTTVSTTPLTLSLYPKWYQTKLESWKRGEIDWDGNRLVPESLSGSGDDGSALEKVQSSQVRRLLVHLRLDSLPSLFTFITLLAGDRAAVTTKVHKAKSELSSVPEGAASDPTLLSSKRPLEVHGLRMLELTERTSSVMRVSEADDLALRDPIVNTFRTFAQLNNVSVSGELSIVPEGSYAETLTSQATDHHSDLVLLPWSESRSPLETDQTLDSYAHGVQEAFIQKALETAICNTAVFINRGFGGPAKRPEVALTRTVSGLSLRSHREPPVPPIADRSHHIYFPFFGGVDDRVALRFVLQLAQNSNVTVTIVHFNVPVQSQEHTPDVGITSLRGPNSSQLATSERLDTDTVYRNAVEDGTLLHTLRDSLPQALANRVVFVDAPTTTPLADCLRYARQEIAQSPKNAGDLVIVGRGKQSRMVDNQELSDSTHNGEMKKTLGVVGEAVISAGIRGSVLVLQAGGRLLDS
jgi:hypothetical protein